jgi:hypothetical protein
VGISIPTCSVLLLQFLFFNVTTRRLWRLLRFSSIRAMPWLCLSSFALGVFFPLVDTRFVIPRCFGTSLPFCFYSLASAFLFLLLGCDASSALLGRFVRFWCWTLFKFPELDPLIYFYPFPFPSTISLPPPTFRVDTAPTPPLFFYNVCVFLSFLLRSEM